MQRCCIRNNFLDNPTEKWLKVTISNGVSQVTIPVIPPRSIRSIPGPFIPDASKIEEERELMEEEIQRYIPQQTSPAILENLLVVLSGKWKGIIRSQECIDVEAGISVVCDKIMGGFRQPNGLFVVFFGSVDTRGKMLNIETHTSENSAIPLKSSLIENHGSHLCLKIELVDRIFEFDIEKSAGLPKCSPVDDLTGAYSSLIEMKQGPQELSNVRLDFSTTGIIVGHCFEQGLEHPIHGFVDLAAREIFFMMKGRRVIYFMGRIENEAGVVLSGTWSCGSESSTIKLRKSD